MVMPLKNPLPSTSLHSTYLGLDEQRLELHVARLVFARELVDEQEEEHAGGRRPEGRREDEDEDKSEEGRTRTSRMYGWARTSRPGDRDGGFTDPPLMLGF